MWVETEAGCARAASPARLSAFEGGKGESETQIDREKESEKAVRGGGGEAQKEKCSRDVQISRKLL